MASADRFDGIEVDRQQARLTGTVDIDPTDVERMSIDSEIVAIVICRVGGAGVDETATGDLVRTNKLKIKQFAIVRDGNLQDELFQLLPALERDGDPEIPFDDPDPYADAPEGVNADGEIPTDVIVPTVTVEAGVPEEEIFKPGDAEPEGPKVRSATPPDLPKWRIGQPDPAMENFLNEEPASV